MGVSRSYKRMALLLALWLCLLSVSGCGRAAEAEPDATVPVLPNELVSLRSNVTLLASNEAAALSEESFAAVYRNLLYSGQGSAYKDYDTLTAALEALRQQCGAYQVYLLSDLDNDLGSLEVTVASSTAGTADACQWGDHHKVEYAMRKAYNGTAAGDMFARQWEDNVLTWTAYAPLLGAGNTVLGVLAVEYPSDILASYPEWNRMSSDWNGVIEPSESN